MTLAVVRSLDSPRRLRTLEETQDFEQELIDQYLLAMVGAGTSDASVTQDRLVLFDFVRFLGRPVWSAEPADADRYLAELRRTRGLARSTVQSKAWTLAQFFEFLMLRYQGDIHALTGVVLCQPIDEFNRPAKADYGVARVPPAEDEVDALFNAWRLSLPEA